MVEVKLFFKSENTCPQVGHERFDAERDETRTVRASSEIDSLKQHPHWTGLNSIIAHNVK